MKPGVLSNVQICRGVAALGVVLGHVLHDVGALDATPYVNWGAGVDIFFVISGFIMVLVAAGSFGVAGEGRRFLERRIIRVAPLYWLATTALLVGAWIAPGLLNVPVGGWWHVASSYLFIPDTRPGLDALRPLFALGWTLNYEILFYVIFAAAMVLPFRIGLGALIALFVAAAVIHVTLPLNAGPFGFWSDPIALEFVLGTLIGAAYHAGVRLGAGAALACAAIGFALVNIDVFAALGVAGVPTFLCFGLPAALMVSGAALGPQLAGMRAVAWGVTLGDVSYALYLSHPFVIRPLTLVWQRALGGRAEGAFFAATVVVCVAVALAVHVWVERPMTRALVARLGAKQGAAPRVPTAAGRLA